jgi:hypothetical protein
VVVLIVTTTIRKNSEKDLLKIVQNPEAVTAVKRNIRRLTEPRQAIAGPLMGALLARVLQDRTTDGCHGSNLDAQKIFRKGSASESRKPGSSSGCDEGYHWLNANNQGGRQLLNESKPPPQYSF